MRHNPVHAVTDPAVVRTLIEENPWATFVSQGPDGALIASHYPVLLDEAAGEELAIVTHVGRPDDELHGLGDGREVLMIIQGPHGYVSPSWYTPGSTPAPTWNFSTAHCHGVPELLDADENLAVLTRLVDHFEQHVEVPMPLDQEIGARIARGTVGVRLRVTRFTCKVKMSADKDEASRLNVLAQLEGSGPYASPGVARDMRRALGLPAAGQ